MEEQKINSFASYNANMKKSLLDKVFFMDKTDATIFVDFGCADGELIKFMNALFPEYTYIGYDISEDMICSAYANIGSSHNEVIGNEPTYVLPDNIHFFTDWKELKSFLWDNHKNDKKAIVLNSVIHEVYSYSTLLDIDTFWENVFSGLFDYVIIRDMLPSMSINKKSNINDIVNIRKYANKAHLSDYENHWGSINENKNLIHFLLKYRWVENWEREVKENYFPLYVENFMEHVDSDYTIDYYEEFILPYTKRQIIKDFRIELKDNTHIKCILRKDN